MRAYRCYRSSPYEVLAMLPRASLTQHREMEQMTVNCYFVAVVVVLGVLMLAGSRTTFMLLLLLLLFLQVLGCSGQVSCSREHPARNATCLPRRRAATLVPRT